MKTLTLLRHAKSEQDSPAGDFGRSLNDRGRADSRRMGTEIRDLGLSFDLILASPAKRVVETLDALADSHDQKLSPRFDRRLYAATPEMLLDIVRSTEDRVDRLLIVGHNPGLERLAIGMTDGDRGQLRQRLLTKFPTGALAEMSLPIDCWREAGTASASISRFVQPRDLALD